MLFVEMVVAVVAIVMVARLLRDRQRLEFTHKAYLGAQATDMLTVEIARLRDRVAVLERIAAAGAWGWRQWLAFKHAELGHVQSSDRHGPVAGRIELADLRERVKKLEAIAAGVDF